MNFFGGKNSSLYLGRIIDFSGSHKSSDSQNSPIVQQHGSKILSWGVHGSNFRPRALQAIVFGRDEDLCGVQDPSLCNAEATNCQG